MNCSGYQKQFPAYLDGSLPRSQREAIERHRRICPACRAELDSLSRTVSLLDDLRKEQLEPSPVVRANLARAIRTAQPSTTWWESFQLQWRVTGLAAQARAWGMGVAVSIAMFAAGAASMGRWQTPAVSLNMGGTVAPAVQPAEDPRSRVRPLAPGAGVVSEPSGRGVRMRAFPESQVASGQPARIYLCAGQPARVYLWVEPDQDLNNAAVYIQPPADIQVPGGRSVVMGSSVAYLVHRTPILRTDPYSQWITVDLNPVREGTYPLRVDVRNGDAPVSQETISLVVAPGAPDAAR